MGNTDGADEGPGLLAPVEELCGGEVSFRAEGLRRFVYMEKLHFTVNGVPHVMDALLCLNHDNASYPTKLYLSQQLGSGLNWNENASFFGRAWYTWSWSGVVPEQPPIEILAQHLAAFERRAVA